MMSDDIDRDQLESLGSTSSGSLDAVSLDPDLIPDSELLGETGIGESTGAGTATGTGIAGATATAGARSRLFGLLALILGIVGSLLMIVVAALVIRFGFGASDTVDRVMEPVRGSFARMEARIDETDDLVDRDGVDAERVDELQARVDGLVDISSGADQVFASVEDHPVYGFLPAELSDLSTALADFEESSVDIDSRLGGLSNGDSLDSSAAAAVADQIDGMQGRVSEVRDLITAAADSLRRWIRFGSFLGFIGSLWGLWGQISLARRGWRGFRGRGA